MASRHAVDIQVFAGTFESQPLAFAHLYDTAHAHGLEIALDAVEVICKIDPTRRLAHYFDDAAIAAITEATGLHTTIVLVFPEAVGGPLEGSHLLLEIGLFPGTRAQA